MKQILTILIGLLMIAMIAPPSGAQDTADVVLPTIGDERGWGVTVVAAAVVSVSWQGSCQGSGDAGGGWDSCDVKPRGFHTSDTPGIPGTGTLWLNGKVVDTCSFPPLTGISISCSTEGTERHWSKGECPEIKAQTNLVTGSVAVTPVKTLGTCTN